MIAPGAQVEHAEFGIGKVLAVLGSTATVVFFGEEMDVDTGDLIVRGGNQVPMAPITSQTMTNLAFRRSFEAINLGVVPGDPEQLVNLTIRGDEISREVLEVLRNSDEAGASRIYMGYYGSGKSHHLRLVKAIARREGWVTASLELDPKSADPAKPSTVYQELMTNLDFPVRADGTHSEDFFDLIKEIRDHWTTIRSLKYFRRSPWFSKGLEALQFLSHRRDEPDYVSAVSWLAGQVRQISAIRSLAKLAGHREAIPPMPQTKDTGLIYGYHLVVMNEILRALGYKGLAIIIDEAEHVRTYSVNRYVRANNFFDILARCAHPPRKELRDPSCDYDMAGVPPFWKEGPHFGLFVGLTEGEDTQDLERKAGEMSVLIHSASEVVQLKPPSAKDYEAWSAAFLSEAASRLGPKVDALADPSVRNRIAGILRRQFEQTPDSEKMLRNWTKMAGFPAAVLLSQPKPIDDTELVAIVEDAARHVAGESLPWDD